MPGKSADRGKMNKMVHLNPIGNVC